MACFPESFLPLPSDHLNAAWGELPNNTMDVMPMSLKADMLFLRAPPPTPVDGTFPVDQQPSYCNSLARNRSDNEGSLLLYETESPPTPDVSVFDVAFDEEDANDDDSSRCGSGGDMDTTTDHPQNSDMASSTTNSDGASSSRRGSPILRVPPVKFQELVDSSIAEIHAGGIEPFVESLLISAIETIQSATIVSMFVQSIIKQLFQKSYLEARDLSRAIRIATMEMFRQHWKADGDWIGVSSTSSNHSPLTLRGVNKAGFMGCLFNAKVMSAEDIFLCLYLLLEGEKHFDRLCAMHALLVQANDKLCKSRNLAALMEFRELLTEKEPVSGRYTWTPTPPAEAILQDILDTIEGWMDTQELKRLRYKTTKTRIPPQAVGPRLGGGSHC
ncbi:hypothetical protein V8B97DRAFT_1866989 [Scleroderma yunnanense]